jgi:DNA polymerase-3 subunit beta
MSLTIQTNALKFALSSLTKVSANNGTLPILTCVHISSKTFQGIVLEATNLEMGLRLHIPGADDDLNVAVPAKTLAEVVAIAGDEALSLSIEGGKLLITGKGIKSRIAIQDADDYPPMPYCEHEAMTMTAYRLKLALKKVVITASNDQCRPALMNVQIAQDHDKITFVAADGFRLAAQEIEGLLDLPNHKTSLCVPATVIRKLIPMLPDDDKQIVTVTVNEQVSQVGFSWPGFDVYASLSEANFPDWHPIVPKDSAHIIELPADFAGAVRLAEVFGKLSSHMVALEPSESGLVVVGADEETGESRTVFSGIPMPFRVGFNAVFAIQGLDAIGCNVHLHLGSIPKAPVMLTNGSREYLYLIMPMLINEAVAIKKAAQAASEVAMTEGLA